VYGNKAKGKFVPMTPQPDAANVITIYRTYATLKRSSSYRRRVSWVSSNSSKWTKPLALVEYAGSFPSGTEAHGNCRSDDCEYVRTKPEVQNLADEQLKSKKRPREVFQELRLSRKTGRSPEKCRASLQPEEGPDIRERWYCKGKPRR